MRLPVRCLDITSIERSLFELERMGLDPAGFRSLAPKQLHYNLKVEGLTGEQTGFIREDASTAPYPVDVASAGSGQMLLSGTLAAVRSLVERLKRRPETLDAAVCLGEAVDNSGKNGFTVAARGADLKVGPGTVIMGILNVTPDSFSDGGLFLDKARAVERALEMCEEGADWIDVGGESTRPGAAPVGIEEELVRVIPVVEALCSRGLTVSIDTTKAEVARQALDAGAAIVNDVSALSADPAMAGVCAGYGAGVVLMHMRGTPRTMQLDTVYSDVVAEVYGYLWSRVEWAVRNGIVRNRLIIDPGLGFGKSVEGNLRLVRDLREFKSMGLPLLVGPSRKSFIGKTLGEGVEGRLAGTLAASVTSIVNGAAILRVHDVKEARQAAALADAIVAS